MTGNHRFHPEFPHELEAELNVLEQISIETGNRFRDTIRNQIRLISDNPESFAVVYDDVRIARIPKYAYAIHYRIVENMPKFLALLHTSRSRRNWPNRE